MRFVLYTDTAGYWRWRLLDSNNRVIADGSESYFNKQDVINGIKLVKSAYAAPVNE